MKIGEVQPVRPTVVFVSVSRGLGGPARSLLTLLQHLGDGFERVLVAPPGQPARLAISQGLVDDHVAMPIGKGGRRRSRIAAAIALARYVRAHRHRIVSLHANGQTELNLTALATALTRVPVAMWAHTSRASPTAGWLAWFWRRRGPNVRCVAVSETARRVVVDTLGLKSDTIEIVGNPIDPDDVVGERLPHQGVRIGYLGLDLPHKGFDLLAPIMDRVNREGVSLELYVAPPRPDLMVELQPAWDQLFDLEGRRAIYHVGRVSDVRSAYSVLDIILCPSRQEAFGRVAAEAMLNGLPVVASDIPALRAVVGHEQGGLLFPPGDAAAAAEAICRLVDEPELRRRLGAQARERARRFVPEITAERFRAIYLDSRVNGRHRRSITSA